MTTIVEGNHADGPDHSGTPSDESTEQQLELARAQGEAFGRAVAEMTRNEADDGSEIAAGDLLVGFAVEDAEGMYHWADGQLQWQDPTDENVHIEVVARDAHDGRFIPGLEVAVTVTTEGGEELGTHEHPFLWHPWLYHYGRNWKVPGSGRYRLSVHIKPAGFMRHDRTNGARFLEPVDVEWPSVRFEVGQKKS
jgi:Fe2+ transport protein